MQNTKISKSVFLVLIAGILFTGIVGCKKKKEEVDPSNTTNTNTTPNLFTDVSSATTQIMDAYAPLSGSDTYGKVLSMYFPYDTDEGNVSGALDAGRRGLGKYNVASTNIEIDGPWDSLYIAIKRANICIKQIPLMNLYNNGSVTEQAALKRLHGEALTIRAQSYFELIRNWGDVPLYLPESGSNLAKTPRDQIYDTLIKDLAVAADLVPWMGDVPRDARITKGAVKGLRAKIALFRAGYSLRTTMMMQQGSNRAYYLGIVRDECKDIMDSGRHGLNASYEDLFKKYVCAPTFDPVGEILFEIAHEGGNAYDDSQLGYYLGVQAHINSTYGQGNGGILTNGVYFYSFDSLDTRKDVTIATYSIGLSGINYDLKAFAKMSNGLRLAKFRREWRAVPVPGATQYLGYNWPIIRYSDILLMYAEAENELNGGPTANAITAFEEVRKRAFNGDASKIGTTPTDYNGFFSAIVNERLLEFGGEGIRKYDLIRWNLLGTKIAEVKSKLQDLFNGVGIYANYPENIYWENVGNEIKLNNSFYQPEPVVTPAGTKTGWKSSIDDSGFSSVNAIGEYYVPNTHDEILPIPQSAIVASPALTQDYGY